MGRDVKGARSKVDGLGDGTRRGVSEVDSWRARGWEEMWRERGR